MQAASAFPTRAAWFRNAGGCGSAARFEEPRRKQALCCLCLVRERVPSLESPHLPVASQQHLAELNGRADTSLTAPAHLQHPLQLVQQFHDRPQFPVLELRLDVPMERINLGRVVVTVRVEGEG